MTAKISCIYIIGIASGIAVLMIGFAGLIALSYGIVWTVGRIILGYV